MQLILASASKYRRKLLVHAGIKAKAIAADIDEHSVRHKSPKRLSMLRALAKAKAVSDLHPKSLVIGSDQVLEFNQRSFDKVTTRKQAFARLKKMSGKKHFLHSAFCLVQNGKVVHKQIVTATLWMRKMSSEEINSYLDREEWQGSVACYKFEKHGGKLFSKVRGDITTIVGLPMRELKKALRKASSS